MRTTLANAPERTPLARSSVTLSCPAMLQRQCACGGTPGPSGECAECRKKRQGLLQRRGNGPEPDAVPPLVHEVLRAPGQSLDPRTRGLMESRFGFDFGHVRVHTDAPAARSARSVNSLAYTVGTHLVFGAGRYAPQTREGLGLLAHELTHVIQQRDAPSALDRQSDDVAAEADAARDRFRADRRRELSGLIDSMRFRKVVRDCAANSGVRLLEVLAGVRSRVAANPRCLEFFRRQFGVDPLPLFSPHTDPTFEVDPQLTRVSGSTRCPRPAIQLRPDVCQSPLRDRVVVHELTHYAGCLTSAQVPSTEALARQGETICMGTVREELDRARARADAPAGQDVQRQVAEPGGGIGESSAEYPPVAPDGNLRLAPSRSAAESEAEAVGRAVMANTPGPLPLTPGRRGSEPVLARQEAATDDPLAAARERALRYQPRFRPHIPRAPTLGEPPAPSGPATPCQRPPDAEVAASLQAADLRTRTEATMTRAINLARSLSAGRSYRATPALLREADRAIRAEFARHLPSGRTFTDPNAVTLRSAADFAALRVPDQTVARRRIGAAALATDPELMETLCIQAPTDPTLQQEVAAPLLNARGLDFVRDYDASHIGGQTTMNTVQGQFITHVDLPRESRNMGHIVVHEAMHFYVSAAYDAAADAHPRHAHAMMEGGAEFLARHVINQRLAQRPEFRINTGTYAEEFHYVGNHLLRGGLSSFALAYFQGRVDLLGF